jgi:AcrR family transcriptional regulator
MKMERTRQLIAETALELFRLNGFDDTTVEQIAAAAEAAPRTVWRYFPTKETLIVEFVDHHLATALDQLRAQPEDAPLPQVLYTAVDSLIATMTANAERVTTAYELAAHTPSVRAQFNELWLTWCNQVAAEIRRRNRSRSSDLTGDMGAMLCMVAIDTSVRAWVESGGKANMRRLVNRALEMLRSGKVPIAAPAA